MTITIIAVGKLKEIFWEKACDEYIKRLSRYCKIKIIEIHDEKVPAGAGAAEIEIATKKESEAILKHLSCRCSNTLVTLEINGIQNDSMAFAKKMDSFMVNGISHFTFVIGGSNGLHHQIIEKSQWHLSFSQMTFPHQLFRIMLLEQIYRGFKINHHETYHK